MKRLVPFGLAICLSGCGSGKQVEAVPSPVLDAPRRDVPVSTRTFNLANSYSSLVRDGGNYLFLIPGTPPTAAYAIETDPLSAFTPLSVTAESETITARGKSIPLPTAAKIGDAGDVMTFNVYTDKTRMILKSIRTASYVIKPDSETTALVTLFVTEVTPTGEPMSIAQATFRMVPQGGLPDGP